MFKRHKKMAARDSSLDKMDALITVTDHSSAEKKKLGIEDIIGYKRLTGEDHFLVLKDDTFCEMLKVRGRGLRGITLNTSRRLGSSFASFNRAFLDDYGWFTMSFPVDTSDQQKRWAKLYRHDHEEYERLTNRNSRHGQELVKMMSLIQDEISLDKRVESRLQNKEFIFMLFGDTVKQLKERIELAKSYGASEGNLLIFEELNEERKEMVLFRLNNPNSIVN